MAIEANELRIGNYVKHNSEWCYRGEDVYIFKWDVCDWEALGKCTLFVENIEPIQLTEKWLLKFGFSIFENMYFIKGLQIWKCNDMFLCDKNGIYIKHVHQLQNLYFALTGKELTHEN